MPLAGNPENNNTANSNQHSKITYNNESNSNSALGSGDDVASMNNISSNNPENIENQYDEFQQLALSLNRADLHLI